jgi:hypothetical protein
MCRLSWNLGASTHRKPQCLSRLVMGLQWLTTPALYTGDSTLYFFFLFFFFFFIKARSIRSRCTAAYKAYCANILYLVPGIWSFRVKCWRIICSVDRASLYDLVNRTNVVHNFSNMFISFLYMFRATMCPSSGEITVFVRHLVLVTLYGWLSGMQGALHTRQSSTQSDKYQVSHRYGIFSWWWPHNCPKHVEERNKHIKKNCAPSWFYVRDEVLKLFQSSFRHMSY